MTREELESLILDTYNAASDHPWPRYPSNQVFRHPGNQKWFALLMDVPASVFASRQPRNKSAGTDDKKVCVLNVKCDPILAGSFRSDPGIHPAYHMNKDKWISIELAIVPEETTLLLLEMSFNATAPKNAISKKQTPKPKKPYPEQFFSDLGIKELLPDADLAESLISFLIAEPISPTYKDDYESGRHPA